MKKSKAITLVLVTALLGCNRNKPEQNHLYMRTDTTGNYTPANSGYHGYYIFRPYGMYYPYSYGGSAGYVHQGYSNAGVHASSSSVSRGGFGRTGGFHASSSS
ncbi:MAG: hypothetical protein V4592_24440 [Bacteroidota bacterium]